VAPAARVDFEATRVQWEPQVDHDRTVLTVSAPDGTVARRELAAGQGVSWDLPAGAADGTYHYELRLSPRIDASTRRELADARKAGTDEQVLARLRAAGRLGEEQVMSGSFLVKDGVVVPPAQEMEPKQPKKLESASAGSLRPITGADQVIADDEIVQGSLCVGLDCVNNESFGFDTIRLKENNTRIKFDDTSTGTGFPANDWQLTANDSASGGSSKFSIEDITGSKVPFTITAGAATNSIFVDSTGRVGFRTSTPVLDLHVNTSNTPAMRLEQNNSGGFTAQTWDIAGNEANFFVRDVTGGSRLPFRIRPGAPTSSIDINASGNVGIGTASPATKLHVSGSDGTTQLEVQESNGTAAARVMLNLINNGNVQSRYENTSTATVWGFNLTGTDFVLNESSTAPIEMTVFKGGNVTIAGTLTQNSDRNTKMNIVEASPAAVLAKVDTLPISFWTYKQDDPKIRHMGPMAQDFAAAFGLGEDERHIAPIDVAGVSLAAIKALHQEVEQKDAAIQALRQQNDDLARRMAELEAKIESLAATAKN
jgi:hypothetical protein